VDEPALLVDDVDNQIPDDDVLLLLAVVELCALELVEGAGLSEFGTEDCAEVVLVPSTSLLVLIVELCMLAEAETPTLLDAERDVELEMELDSPPFVLPALLCMIGELEAMVPLDDATRDELELIA
jgi:hypothetical protein